MKFSLTTSLLILACFSIAVAWYSERSRYTKEKSAWQSERINILHAAMVLAEREQQVAIDDEGNGGFIGIPLTKQQQERVEEQSNTENLVVYINLENEIKIIFGKYLSNQSDVNLAFEEFLIDYWCGGGKPSVYEIKKLVGHTNQNLKIERPDALKSWIEKLKQSN